MTSTSAPPRSDIYLRTISVAAVNCTEPRLISLKTALAPHHHLLSTYSSLADLALGLLNDLFSCAIIYMESPDHDDDVMPRLIKSLAEVTPLIIIANRCDVSGAVRIMKAGAFDIIVGDPSPTALAPKIFEAIKISSKYVKQRILRAEALKRLWRLSPREFELVQLLIKGYHNKEIATQLGLSCRTVESYRKNTMRKMRVNSICDLVRATMDIDLSVTPPFLANNSDA